MKLTFKYQPKLTTKATEIINELSFHTTKLYNIVNFTNHTTYHTYIDNEKTFKGNWHNDFLHSHNYQHALKVLDQNWTSYFKSIKDYKKKPSKYNGIPKPPKYKNCNNNPNEVIFTKMGIRYDGQFLKLSLSKTIQGTYKVKSLNLKLNKKVLELLGGFDAIQQVRLSQSNGQWICYIIYKQAKLPINITHSNIMGIDLGLNNLATITFLKDAESVIFDGKALKAKNAYYNNELSRLMSIRMKQTGSDKFKLTDAMKHIYLKREHYINNYLHLVSSKIIKIAQVKKVGKIIIGDLGDIKRHMNYNKHFVQIPIKRLGELIAYKAKLNGIQAIFLNESYTSICSAIDLEPIVKQYANKKRRTHRGLFKSNDNILINADVNGSLNILRKHTKTIIPDYITVARANGFVNNPIRIRVA